MNADLTPEWLDRLLEADRHDDALAALNQALAEHPDDARLYALRGDLMAASWRHRAAAEDWETALSLDPSLHPVRLRLALLEATRPYRLTGGDEPDGGWDDENPEDDGESSEAWDALEQQLLDVLNTDPSELLSGTDWPDADGLPDDGDDSQYFEPRDEDSVRARGLKRLQFLVDETELDENSLCDIAVALSEQAGLPWHALDVLQRALAAHPGSLVLRRALVSLWARLAHDAADVDEDVPAGFSADLTGNLFHPVSAATALQLCDALPAEAWDAGLLEQRAGIHRLLGDHASAAADFDRAATLLENRSAADDGDEDARAWRERLLQEAAVSRGGDRALIAARRQQMQETVSRLAELQQAMGLDDDGEDEATIREARAAADEYIETIGHDPADDEDYVREVCGQMPQIAEAILNTIETEPYEALPLGERELFAKVGPEDAALYLAQRAAFGNLGFATVGWLELQALSRRLERPAVLDLLLSPDHGCVVAVFVLNGIPTLETHSLFSDGAGLSLATIRGRSAGWTPPPFRQFHLPPETGPELLLRLHDGAVREYTARTGADVVTLHPGLLPRHLDEWRARRARARLMHGFHDAELRGYTREHYRVARDTLQQELEAGLARLQPRMH